MWLKRNFSPSHKRKRLSGLGLAHTCSVDKIRDCLQTNRRFCRLNKSNMIWNFLSSVHTCNLSTDNRRTFSMDTSSRFCLQVYKCVPSLNTYLQTLDKIANLCLQTKFCDYSQTSWEQIACSATTHRQKSHVYGLPPRMENLRHVLQLFVMWKLLASNFSKIL